MKREKAFVKAHLGDNVRTLALQAGRYPDMDMPWALQQIAGWQTAKEKLPTWAAIDAVEYPVHLSMEQCSSEQTAHYKARLAQRLLRDGQQLLDLTGGLGVDCSFMARHFHSAIYVEQNETLCQLAQHNFAALGLAHIQVVHSTAEAFLSTLASQDSTLIYLDPARRDAAGTRTYSIEDCTPNLLQMKAALLEAANVVMAKLSPMLDWHRAVEQLDEGSRCVAEVHIVATKNECKELILILKKDAAEPLALYCINDEQEEIFHPAADATNSAAAPMPQPAELLYVPNAAVMKSGCFAQLAQRYALAAAAEHSHLFFSNQIEKKFPGRVFRIERTSTMNKKELRAFLAGVERANIAVRNFPLTAQQLKSRLRLSDGGDQYIFATTLADGTHQLFLCQKISE